MAGRCPRGIALSAREPPRSEESSIYCFLQSLGQAQPVGSDPPGMKEWRRRATTVMIALGVLAALPGVASAAEEEKYFDDMQKKALKRPS